MDLTQLLIVERIATLSRAGFPRQRWLLIVPTSILSHVSRTHRSIPLRHLASSGFRCKIVVGRGSDG